MSALRALNSVLLPKMRAPREVETAVPTGAILSTKLRSSLGLWVLLPLIGGALIFSTHMVMNTFSAIVWKNQGISAGTIGALIAVGAAAEAAVMFSWARLQNWFGARQLVLIASFAACIRWLIMAASPPVWLLFPLQLMQGVTFTFSYLGCLYFIANRTDESVSAEAQSLFGVMQQGASVLAVLSFGLLFDYVGVHAFGGVALLSAGVAGLIIWSLKIMPSGVGQD
ncbi:MAG: MFS transporter [Rhodobacteraceae bacterium]|nr:MFS transporter [Paracoccaceae bacterium]